MRRHLSWRLAVAFIALLAIDMTVLAQQEELTSADRLSIYNQFRAAVEDGRSEDALRLVKASELMSGPEASWQTAADPARLTIADQLMNRILASGL